MASVAGTMVVSLCNDTNLLPHLDKTIHQNPPRSPPYSTLIGRSFTPDPYLNPTPRTAKLGCGEEERHTVVSRHILLKTASSESISALQRTGDGSALLAADVLDVMDGVEVLINQPESTFRVMRYGLVSVF